MNLAALTPEQFQAAVLGWIAALVTIIPAAFGVIALVFSKIKDLKAQVDKHSDRIHDIALAQPSIQQQLDNGPTMLPKGPSLPVSVIIALLLPALALSGCAGAKAWFANPDNQAKLKATGEWLVSKAEQIAINTVASAAQSQMDAGAKADWMDSLATGLRTNAVADFSSDDVKSLIGIWTPDKPHWQDLGAQLADIAKQAATVPPAQRNEAIAQALNQAALLLRAQSTAPTQVFAYRLRSAIAARTRILHRPDDARVLAHAKAACPPHVRKDTPDAPPTLYSANGEPVRPLHFAEPTVILRAP